MFKLDNLLFEAIKMDKLVMKESRLSQSFGRFNRILLQLVNYFK